eukprot:14045258-Alexandrium_andersonii.AAC.1
MGLWSWQMRLHLPRSWPLVASLGGYRPLPPICASDASGLSTGAMPTRRGCSRRRRQSGGPAGR